MTVEDANAPEEIMWSGRWITAKRKGRWEYVSRVRGITAAVILPLDVEDVILVEQYRVPIGCPCIELPAGLIGDEDSLEGEDPLGAAKRELEEETGYRAHEWAVVGEFHSTPGMSSESFTFLVARQLERVGDGGGVENENIVVHRVPLASLSEALAAFRAEGKAVDAKLLALLGPQILGVKA
jgi:ADP-ribose pyrophosphatase